MPADAQRFVIRAYQPGDENAIVDLFARSFHQPMPIETWRWRYEQDPSGAGHASLAFDDSRLVAHYAGYPVLFHIDGQLLAAHQIGDTMTDSSVRQVGRGPSSVLARTAAHFYEHFCEGKVAFNYGFNVANIQKFSMRFLRAERVEPVYYRVRDLRARPFARLGKLERWLRGVTLEIVKSTSAEWDQFFRRTAPHYRFLVRRDARYVEWRYLRSPSPSHVIAIRKWRTLVGWVVIRMRENRLVLGDFLLDPEHADVLELTLRHLDAVFAPALVETWCPPRPAWLAALFNDLGFEDRPEPQDLSLMCVPFILSDAADRMRSALFYTMGDSDLF